MLLETKLCENTILISSKKLNIDNSMKEDVRHKGSIFIFIIDVGNLEKKMRGAGKMIDCVPWF